MGSYTHPRSGAAVSPRPPSTTETAQDEAREVGQSVKQAGNQVAETATEQVKEVVGEAGRQARDLLDEGRHQIREQARTGQQKAADGLSAIADELRRMADKGGQSGIASELARQAAERVHGVASWLHEREPETLLDEVRNWARRRPGVFLLGAAAAGAVAGRLTRGAVAAQRASGDDSSAVPSPRIPAPSEVPPLPHLSPGVTSPSASELGQELGGPGAGYYPGGRVEP